MGLRTGGLARAEGADPPEAGRSFRFRTDSQALLRAALGPAAPLPPLPAASRRDPAASAPVLPEAPAWSPLADVAAVLRTLVSVTGTKSSTGVRLRAEVRDGAIVVRVEPAGNAEPLPLLMGN